MSTVFSWRSYFDLENFVHAALFENCTHVWEVLQQLSPYLSQLSLGEIEGVIDSGAHLVNSESITLGKGSVVEAGAYIQGPCWLGAGCVVRHGAYLRGYVLAGDGCVLGHATEVKNSILLPKAHAAHFAYLGDSILGSRVNLGAGTKCANLRFDKKEIVLHHKGERHATGLRKLGAIIGDDAQLGCNVVTNPGTCLGKGVCVLPSLAVGGVVPEKAFVKSNARTTIIA